VAFGVLDQPPGPEHLPVGVARLGDAIGVQQQLIARFEGLLADERVGVPDAQGRASAAAQFLQ
jgi:hypothetical protein